MITYCPAGKLRSPGRYVVIAAASHLRVLAKQKQTLRDGVNQSVGDFYAAARAAT
jgi:hypothetical protein